jgi:hypothetical protein
MGTGGYSIARCSRVAPKYLPTNPAFAVRRKRWI